MESETERHRISRIAAQRVRSIATNRLITVLSIKLMSQRVTFKALELKSILELSEGNA